MIFNESIYNKHWNTKKLNELGTFNRGKSKHRPRNDLKLFKNGIYPFIQTGDIKNSILYISSHTQNYNEFGLAQSKLWNKGTLCITIASNIADTAVLAYPMCFPDSVVGFIANPTESSEIFMHYIFTYIQKYIQNSVIGSIQDNINIDYLQNLEFKIPSKEYQEKITFILSSIDKKIELNNKINSELENMAKTIYDYWFLQFEFPNDEGKPYKSSGGKMVWNEELKKEIPDGWKLISIKECIQHIKTGLNPRNNFKLGTGNIKYITVKNLTTSGNINFSNCDLIDEEARIIVNNRSEIKKGDILFASIAPLGRCFIIQENPKDWDINESVFTIRPNYDKISSEFLYMFFMSEYFIKKAEASSTGSIFSGIRINTIGNMKILIPDKKIIDSFTDKVNNLFYNKFKNNQESQELISLRDYLLPLLMNGQVGFKD